MKETARETATRVQARASEEIEGRKASLAGQMEGVALAVRRAATDLRGQGQEPVAGYAEGLADRLGRLSSSLRDQDLRALSHKAEDFARREPALFIGGALALGFGVARFLKSGDRSVGRGGR